MYCWVSDEELNPLQVCEAKQRRSAQRRSHDRSMKINGGDAACDGRQFHLTLIVKNCKEEGRAPLFTAVDYKPAPSKRDLRL